EDGQGRQPDDHRGAAQGPVADGAGQPELGRGRRADRVAAALGVGRWQAAAGVPRRAGAARAASAEARLGGLTGRAFMHLVTQVCILGLLTGGVYALMASGLTLAFGVRRVINVAQGAMIILGAYVSYSLFTRLHIDPFVSILVMTPAMFLLGVGLQLAFLRPLRSDESEELSLLVTWAIALGI